MAEGLTDDEKYQQGWHDALEKQGEKPQDEDEIIPDKNEVRDIEQNLAGKDEKIRKGLIENFKWFCGDFPETAKWGKDDGMLVKDIITWLEKQSKEGGKE